MLDDTPAWPFQAEKGKKSAASSPCNRKHTRKTDPLFITHVHFIEFTITKIIPYHNLT